MYEKSYLCNIECCHHLENIFFLYNNYTVDKLIADGNENKKE